MVPGSDGGEGGQREDRGRTEGGPPWYLLTGKTKPRVGAEVVGASRANNDFIKGLLALSHSGNTDTVTVIERQMLERTREYSEFVNKANIIYCRPKTRYYSEN